MIHRVVVYLVSTHSQNLQFLFQATHKNILCSLTVKVVTPVVVETASINNEGGNMATSAIVETVFINSESGNNNGIW